MKAVWLLVFGLALAAPSIADAKTNRSGAVKAEFKRANPCSANGNRRGACPGYVIDHVKPLCAGGADHVGNLQWQTIADAKAKDKIEVAKCRQMGRRHRGD